MRFTDLLTSVKEDPEALDPETKLLKVPYTRNVNFKFSCEPRETKNLVIVDTETTGFNAEVAEVIEVAAVGMKVCIDTGEVCAVGAMFNYFNQPSSPIPSKITQITGITNADVEGKVIKYPKVYSSISKADVIVAHNAAFDRPFFDKLPLDWDEIERPWGCSCYDPDWPSIGPFPNRKLEGLVKHSGFTYNAHRAIDDCLATAFLLSLYPQAVLDILRVTEKPLYKLSFNRIPYGSNDLMKSKSFNFRNKVWFKYYESPDEMTVERREIYDQLKRFPGNNSTVSINSLHPLSRFASGL